ncbi:response regulator [bacterium]|nr:MAG: response regulator [bacterium]
MTGVGIPTAFGVKRFRAWPGSSRFATRTTRWSTTVRIAPAARSRRRSRCWSTAPGRSGIPRWSTCSPARYPPFSASAPPEVSMKDLLPYLQNISALAFLLLGVLTAVTWVRRRDPSVGFLALAIVLLALVSSFGRITSLLHLTSPALTQVSLFAFVGSGYALLRYRGSLIPLTRTWHIVALVATVAAVAVFLAAQVLVAAGIAHLDVETGAAIALVLVWAALVVEPTVRFWLVARGVPAVQAWRLRSLSIGFAGIVAILLFAVLAGEVANNPVAQVVIQVLVIAIVPLLYVSFSPPAWLRRQWRASEEEGLRAFMEQFLLSDDRDALANRALEWAMRIVGGGAAASFADDGTLRATRGLEEDQIGELKARLPELHYGVSRVAIAGAEATVLTLPIAGLSGSGTLVVLAGPFSPSFGGDEMSRVQQLMSAFVTALDRMHLVAQLKESNARLQDANRHKSVFLASMSHELRTPLNAILGFSELLIDANNGQYPPATRKRFLEQIHSSGKHLLGLINDILDLSKIEAGQMELRLQTVSVAEVVQQVLSTVEPLAAQKQIQIKPGEVDAGEITVDPGKFKQMLLNLLSNAVKFTPEGGVVTIQAQRLADAVEVAVADNGIGIAGEDQERVFNEFQQVDSGVGRQQPGTGLGLTLTRRFANLHGGDVRLVSELGKGSVFTLTLPTEPRRAMAPAPAPPAPAGRVSAGDHRPLVLVVEDDPGAAELLTRQIERSGFKTEVARTGTEALIKAHDDRPAAITLDILLPDLDGWEVLTRLKRDEATMDIPVIVVSVVDNPELGVALGALDYFVKPVQAAELMSRLARFNLKQKGGEKLTVLVVDDEEANRDWLRRVLVPAGFDVVVAAGGKEAIELAKTLGPDLVLLDLMMPEVTGFDVVEALRADESTRAIPIMVLTAKNLTDADIRQLNGHVSTILRRGSTGASDLLELLRQVVITNGNRR